MVATPPNNGYYRVKIFTSVKPIMQNGVIFSLVMFILIVH